jgi:tetratricopeptide (TPR) repeat protein
MTIEQAMEQAVAHHQAGRMPQAESIYRQILATQPNHADALHLLGVVAAQSGRHEIAHELIRQAIAIRPNVADYYGNLGRVLAALNRPDEAIATFRQALSLRPDYPEALKNLGNALKSRGRVDEAIECYERAIKLKPDFFEAGYDLGNALMDRDRLADAISSYQNTVAHKPDYVEAWNNLGNALKENGQIDQAIVAYQRTLNLRPDFLPTRFNLGIAQLLLGDFANGFQNLEARRQLGGLSIYFGGFTKPAWTGDDLNGRTILLYCEQGLGDTIQFARYVPLVAQRGAGTIIVQCQPELSRLLTQSGAKIVTRREDVGDFDVHCPLMSLPAVMKTTLETIPGKVPYLQADPELSSEWRKRIPDNDTMKVGLAWAGTPQHSRDRARSIPFGTLAPLAAIPDTTFISLQKRHSDSSLIPPPSSFPLLDWTDALIDFAETAALIDNLDLVITVDTAVAHLAGAMCKRVKLLLPFVPDWRWMLGRQDSPWYPTIELVRQSQAGDWRTPIARIVEDLLRQ